MANPNIVTVSSIYGSTNYLIPSTTAATTWTALTPAAGTVNKIDNIVASNVTGSVATVTVAIKSTAFYLGEAQSIVVTVGTASAIELTSSYEAIT